MTPSVKAKPKLARLFEVRRVFKRYNLLGLVDEFDLPKGARLMARIALGKGAVSSQESPRAERLRNALEDLGPVFVKLGQALSTRPDLIPDDIAFELAKLQDDVPPFDAEQSMAIIKGAYGDQVDAIFKHIDPQPMASASVAQVHAATLVDGLAIAGQAKTGNEADLKDQAIHHEVIIKVLRPGIEKTVRSDLEVMHFFAGLLQKYWSRGRQFRPQEVVQEYENTILGELDLRVEAANGARMGANFEDQDVIYVPRIYWDYTQRNVLVMERIFGTSMRKLDEIRASGIDLETLAADGVSVFFKQAFEDNFFHADMHSGNIFVSEQGKWIAIDFGIMGTLTNTDKHYLAEILLGFFNRDYARITRAHFRSGWVGKDTNADDFELALRIVCEPIFAKPLSQISFGKVLVELFQTVRRFEMPVQPQLVLLYKTLLNIEGLGRQLYPDLNLWDTAKPYLEEWMKQQMSPKALLEELAEQWPYIRQDLLNGTLFAGTPLNQPNVERATTDGDTPSQKSKTAWFVAGLVAVVLMLSHNAEGSLSWLGSVSAPVIFSASPLQIVAAALLAFSLYRLSR